MYVPKAAKAISILVAIALAACSAGPAISSRGADSAQGDLDGTAWQLVSLNGSNVWTSEIFMGFRDGWVTGFAGCNSYSGEYTATADGDISFGPVAITDMVCGNADNVVMERERVYMAAFLDVAAYSIVGGRLEFANADGDTTLVYVQIA